MIRNSLIAAVVLFLAAGFAAQALAADEVIVVSYAGEVKVIPPDKMAPETCTPGMVLKEGTRLITGDGSYVMLAFDRPRRNLVKVKANSEVILKLGEEDRIELIDGKLYTLINDIDKGSVFRIRTPDAVCGARGTGWLTEILDGATGVSVFDDKVFVSGINPDGSVMQDRLWVLKGFRVEVKKGGKPGRPEKIPAEQVKSMADEFGQGAGEADMAKLKKLDNIGRLREEQIESIQERRDEKRTETQEKRQEERPTGGARMKTIGR